MNLHLSFTISPDRKRLTIHADAAARAELAEMRDESPEEFGSDAAMCEAFESLIANSELTWVDPETCGDMTEAPILGIWGEERPGKGNDGEAGRGSVLLSSGPNGFTVADVVERWGYMSYALRSPLADLLDKGEAVFVAP
jgi:hypothetical protein